MKIVYISDKQAENDCIGKGESPLYFKETRYVILFVVQNNHSRRIESIDLKGQEAGRSVKIAIIQKRNFGDLWVAMEKGGEKKIWKLFWSGPRIDWLIGYSVRKKEQSLMIHKCWTLVLFCFFQGKKSGLEERWQTHFCYVEFEVRSSNQVSLSLRYWAVTHLEVEIYHP